MKRLINASVIFFILFAWAIWLENPRVEIPVMASKHVVAFKLNSYGGKIYGSGFHAKHKGKVFIITNQHVCEVGRKYGKNEEYVQVNNRLVKIIKEWKKHDLCALESWADDGLEIADSTLEELDKLYLIGHPRGLPLVIREGRMISVEDVCIMYGVNYICRVAVRISALAYGGNSGSPVINEYGDLVGVLFAGSPKYPHEPFMVPHEYLKEFLDVLVEPIKKLQPVKPLE